MISDGGGTLNRTLGCKCTSRCGACGSSLPLSSSAGLSGGLASACSVDSYNGQS